jgi:hypothetical protein
MSKEEAYQNKKKIVLAAIVLAIFLVALTSYAYHRAIKSLDFSVQNNYPLTVKNCPDCVRRNLDGVYVSKGKEIFYPIAVMIDNHVDARPQTGLSHAGLVYEAEVEGGITRYLAVFSNFEDVKSIGPIRSARPYFVDWAAELSALYVHVGGSDDSLTRIARANILDLNEIYKGAYFFRDQTESAPHNAYINTVSINKYLNEQDAKDGKFLSWNFKNDAPLSDRPASGEIKILYRTTDFVVQWSYQQGSNNYIRSLGGKPHADSDGNEIGAKNVIIIFVKSKVVDDKLRLSMDTIGSDKATICMDGKCADGTWKKISIGSRIRFYDANNQEISLNAGNTWVEVVQPGTKIMNNE